MKFHWTPKQGMAALVWDEAQKIAGKDPDYHRRDLYQAIENGFYPEWELGVQIVEQEDEMSFDFDLLDPTKLIPEELVPVIPIGRMVLNRNIDNFFDETEQVAFCPAHIVPGIDFTNDPLLQARIFSYTDTQLSRLGVRTSISCRLTRRCVRFTITSAMASIRAGFIAVRRRISPTRLTMTGHEKPHPQPKVAVLKAIRNALTGIKSVSAVHPLAITFRKCVCISKA